MPADLILASASPRRLSLLAQIGVVPARVVAPEVDETPLKNERPRDYVQRVAAGHGSRLGGGDDGRTRGLAPAC